MSLISNFFPNLGPPEIDYHPASLDVEEGASAFFECKYKGNEFPVTVVEWEKSGDPVPVNFLN